MDGTNYTIKDVIDLTIKKIFWDELLISDFSLLLREKWFIRKKFSTSILILDIKYNYLRLKYQNSFYLFNNQLDYALAYFFAKLEII